MRRSRGGPTADDRTPRVTADAADAATPAPSMTGVHF
jgi:hypothetical protein